MSSSPSVPAPGRTPRLRPDVRQHAGDGGGLVLEDPLAGRFFRLGPAEAAVVRGLAPGAGGNLPAAPAAPESPALDEAQTQHLFRWLAEQNLLGAPPAADADRRHALGAARRARAARPNPLYLRVPLAHPERFFEWATPWCRGAFSRPAVAVALLTWLVAAAHLAMLAPQMASASHRLVPHVNWLLVVAAWLLLKPLHELAHGVVCTKYGGVVREAGLLFIFFAPRPYVDVTSCWRFRSRWRRMAVAAAGAYVDLTAAAAAFLLWAYTEPGLLNQLALATAITAGPGALLFNLNPLMRFDGYYLLSDLVGRPNLSAQGQLVLGHWVRRALGRTGDEPPVQGFGPRAWIGLYGLASWIWQTTALLGIAALVMSLWPDGAPFVAAGCGVWWLAGRLRAWRRPAARAVPGLSPAAPSAEEPLPPRRALLAAAAAGLALWLPWPFAPSAPAVVEDAPLTVLRAGADGFLHELHAADGDVVAPGETLFVLVNDALHTELADLALQQEICRRRADLLRGQGKLAEQSAELERGAALARQFAEKERQAAGLQIAAPHAGRLLCRGLAERRGCYFQEGDVLGVVADERGRELKISLAQEDLAAFEACRGRTVRARFPGLAPVDVTLETILPRADGRPEHVALAATHGGPLAVAPGPPDAPGGEASVQYLAPRFSAVGRFAEAEGVGLRAGQVGVVSAAGARETVGQRLARLADGWRRAIFDPAGAE